jgi:Tetratricopeptide repeat
VVFVVDDLGAWLVGLLADASLKKLTTLVLGSDQERALRQAAKAAVERTAEQLAPSDGEQAQQLATAIGDAFSDPAPDAAVARRATLLEALQAGIVGKLAVLDDPALTRTGQSSADLLGVPGGMLAETLAGHLVREILVRGSRGGPLMPLADQLNHDMTHLQGRRLEGMLAQLASQVMALAQASSAEAPSKPVRLPPRPVFLAGREELLAEVGTRLAAGDDLGPRLVVLCGLGGVGKTTVAVEYAHQHLTEVGVCWRFPAEDRGVLAAEFGVLAAELGVREVLDPRDPVASVHAMLAQLEAGWLVVFDSARDWASVEAFVPPAGRGQVLITTQNQLWPPGLALDVPVLDREVAADFLVSRTGDTDRRAALELSIELGGLPLALEQAAAYVQATLTGLARYLLLFRARMADLLDRGFAAGHPATVAATLGLALSRLEQEAPTAVGLLRLLAFLAPEPVPLGLLLADESAGNLSGSAVAALVGPPLGDPVAAGDAVAALRRYSLVTPAGDALVLMHRLVQAITRDQLPADAVDQWKQAAAALVEAAVPADTELPNTWPACAVLLAHARAVLPLASSGMVRMGRYLGFSGSYPAARDLLQLIADAYRDDPGPEHPETLAVLHELADCAGQAGDAAGARDQLATLLPVRERVLGAEHPGTLATRHDLAHFTGEAGDAAGARDQYAALLRICERALGTDHPETLETRGDLAGWIGEAGDAAGARDQLAALLPIRERVQGTEHPGTLTTRHELAYWTGHAGDAAGARDQLAALLPIRERVLGRDHPSTLAARHNLAYWTGHAGDAAGARDQFAALLAIREQVQGAEHPSTLAARHNLARWTGAAGDAAGARDQLAALLPIRERVLGSEHFWALASRHELARWTGEAGDAAGARDQLAALLPIRERVLGREHPDTLATREELARRTEQESRRDE